MEALSKLVPAWKRHHGFRFFWETPSQSARPNNQQLNSSVKSRRGSVKDCAQNSKDTDSGYGGIGHNKSARLSAIPERGSSSVGDDSLPQDTNYRPILQLATPPPTIRSAPQSPTSTSPPLTPFVHAESQFTSLPGSPMGYCLPPGTSSEFSSGKSTFASAPQLSNSATAQNGPNLSTPRIPMICASPEDSFKTMKDKLDTISVDSNTPLQEVNDEPIDDATLEKNSQDSGKQHCYRTVDGESLGQLNNVVNL